MACNALTVSSAVLVLGGRACKHLTVASGMSGRAAGTGAAATATAGFSATPACISLERLPHAVREAARIAASESIASLVEFIA